MLERINKFDEGDVIISNDPYAGGQHLLDVQFFSPVFVDKQLVAFVANIAHQTGGQTFTAVTPQALHVVFDRIDRMQKVEIRSEKPQVIDFFDPFFAPALALLGLQLLAGLGLRFTPW